MCSIRTLYADCLLIHDSLRNLAIRIKSVCTWKMIRFQSESEKEMNVATRKAGRATCVWDTTTLYLLLEFWDLMKIYSPDVLRIVLPGGILCDNEM